ncbi:hypothetical protein [Sphingomonas sp. NFR15]|uniref:hypothetical protein n=1 Tax=Sphingomonas sp. NFR15 TaxID=1566282 RepID=UPI000887AEBF|nr:hypothetical protein [Sphingomonas sp. NFR15]SDA15160.1 hypothetical protein SAMN03159340_00651 [Sphingomonas sp. NFR15]
MADASANPAFVGLSNGTHAVIEKLLSDIHAAGEWTDEHEALLAAWRASRVDAAKDEWRWWVGAVDDDSYAEDFATRDEAIAAGPAHAEEGCFQIIEARFWADNVKDGAEITDFADCRNHEILEVF